MDKIGSSIHLVCRHPQNASRYTLYLIPNSQLKGLTSRTLSPTDPEKGDH